jgi:two-component system chemotaxis response regulator CheY
MKMLIADDSFLSRQLMLDILRPFGECDVACDGREAMYAIELAWSNGSCYDLIALDVDMPNRNGREVLAFLRGRERERGIFPGNGSKVLMATSHRDPQTIFGTFRDGCEAYLVKPIHKQRVLDELTRLGFVPEACPATADTKT